MSRSHEASASQARPRQSVEDQMRLLVESIRDYAVFMLGPDGDVQSWNAGAMLIKGYRSDEIIGKPMEVFYTPEDRKAGKPRQLLGIALREGRVEDEGWRVRKDGTHFWADVVITALRDESGQLQGFAKVTRDLSERQRAMEERLRLAHAEEAIRLRDEFLSLASHELKTPLTALQLQLESLEEHIAALGQQKLTAKVERAGRSSRRLAALIDSLLDVSRIATGRMPLLREPVDLCALAEQAIATFAAASARAGCALTLHCAAPLSAELDPNRIEQMFANLIANSLKYGAGLPVEVTLSRQGDQAVIAISDRGPGISEVDLGRIFERFERAAAVRNYGGFGLGLWVAREIAQAHGGSIRAENRPGGGACFTAHIPLGPADGEESV
jgi:PAS domain S-box-containing protein